MVFKAATNVFSSLVKWLAFGLVVLGLENAALPCHSEEGSEVQLPAGRLTEPHCCPSALSTLEVGAGTQGFMAELEMARHPVLPSR